MPFYTLYIEDDRYLVPTLLSEELTDDARATVYATRLFAKSTHYKAIDLWDGDRHVGRCSRPEAEAEASPA